VDQEYIRTGRFIHDELIRRCMPLTDTVMKHFRRDKFILPTLLIWPADTVKSLDGNMFSGVIFTELSADEAVRKQEIKDSILRTAAFAALVTEQLPDVVRMIFESGHGTRTWRLPIKDHGNVQVLERTPPRDNVESLGVLWTAN
jgi:hypothetical protein